MFYLKVLIFWHSLKYTYFDYFDVTDILKYLIIILTVLFDI